MDGDVISQIINQIGDQKKSKFEGISNLFSGAISYFNKPEPEFKDLII